jgi:polyphosphate glucokinase
VPNTEFGHIQIDGSEAEDQAAASVKTKENLDWPEWTRRLNRVIAEMERLMSPVRTILGGGISENFQHFGPLLKSKGEIAVARLGNAAGLIGAALTTRELS